MTEPREVRVTYDPLVELLNRGRPDNPKGHDLEAIEDSIDTVGYVEPIIVNDSDGQILAGHGRVAALHARQKRGDAPPEGVTVSEDGDWLIPVLHGVELSDEDARRYVLAANQTTILGGWQEPALADILGALEGTDDGLVGTGFDVDDLAALRESLREPTEGKTDPDEVPELADEPYVQRGDLYSLGGHRLLCGDATEPKDVMRLLGGDHPNLTVTDPPYGVNYDPAWRTDAAAKGLIAYAAARVGVVTNDDRADWREAYALAPGDVIYLWHDARVPQISYLGLAESGFDIRTQIIWAKPRFVISRGHYNGQHEPCWYAVRKGAPANWIGDASESTLWSVSLDQNVAGGLSTQKPVECMERALRNHEGDVYDPFLGSGTTMIAAERLGRRCYGMDIDPRSVQVTIERWQGFTGRKARRLSRKGS